ncbi:GNAT family N-acetyltransferase [Saccharibacillus sp. CPCC 101409]|uniref:GNAT family N-acetyltransferase n=1 Tax=Saccharibacillus sp. CPCC 101409 TaxID=3058041 RepID=UPI00267129CB|nr:GNAT family N-acetyltransferase [Saccharibacillus sp. CPCC 101409]MDO3412206.1 GNAT family N-acetyltransferase [Saccharibacillus sp. CPCC 101409]
MIIRPYEETDEQSWLRCRVLAFLDTAYYDNVLREKERYEHPAIELVAAEGEKIVGLLDIELDTEPGSVCSNGEKTGGMIWHLAVHPDYRRQGIARMLLNEAVQRAKALGAEYLEAWTRDDEWVREWYASAGFQPVDSYFQVHIDGGEELKDIVESRVPLLRPVSLFAHYTGSDKAYILSKFTRVHETVRYDLELTEPQ